jgi:hypothetical protein
MAFCIPRRIMINQLYADLVQEYRSAEMGAAILAIFRFYIRDCKEDVGLIDSTYKEKYEIQIKR